MENPIKMDDLGVPLFSETAIYHDPLYLTQKTVMTPLTLHQNDYDAVLVTYHDNGFWGKKSRWMRVAGCKALLGDSPPKSQ